MRNREQKRRDEELRRNENANVTVQLETEAVKPAPEYEPSTTTDNLAIDRHDAELHPALPPFVTPISSDLDEIYQLKMKKIDEDIYAMPIEKVGCIVKVNGSVVFVPNAALSPDGDGNFDLILGKVYK
jgi:hypothetical protein